MSKVTLEMISNLDWITITDMEDPEVVGEMEVLNVAEMLLEDGESGLFLLVGDVTDDEDEEEEESEAFIFKICEEEGAEFRIEDKDAGRVMYATTEFSDKEYSEAAGLFMETTADFDVELEDDNEENE